MNIEIVTVGVVVICGLAVVIFRRRGLSRDDYGYHVPRTGTWGVGQISTEQAMRDAERGITRDMGEE